MLAALVSGLIGSILGGLIAGYFSIRAVKHADESDTEKRNLAEARALRGLLQALHDELDTINTIYQDGVGAQLEALPEGQPFLMFYPVVNDFFTVYNGNAFLIGKIDDNDLRKSLVQTYVMAKGLVDSFRLNNDILSKFEYWHYMAAETNNPIHQQQAKERYQQLVGYAARLKKGHTEAKRASADLLRRMHKHGVLHEA